MKITDVRTFVVANPPPQAGGRYFLFVKLTTDAKPMMRHSTRI